MGPRGADGVVRVRSVMSFDEVRLVPQAWSEGCTHGSPNGTLVDPNPAEFVRSGVGRASLSTLKR